MKEGKSTTLPEAPASVTIKGFYKGYSVLLTNRDEEIPMSPLLKKAIKAIDWMVENGFKPSWDEKPASSSADKNTCPHTNTMVRVSKSEKNPNRSFKYCTDCRGFVGWVD